MVRTSSAVINRLGKRASSLFPPLVKSHGMRYNWAELETNQEESKPAEYSLYRAYLLIPNKEGT
jgi:hypothetical protein